MIDLIPVESSNVDKVGYDEEKQELHILFKTGGLYIYEAAPKSIHSELMAADSIGGMVHKLLVKTKHKFRKADISEVGNVKESKQD